MCIDFRFLITANMETRNVHCTQLSRLLKYSAKPLMVGVATAVVSVLAVA